MKHSVPYGDGSLQFEVPDENLLAVAAPNAVVVDRTPEVLTRGALSSPIGADLPGWPGSSVAIICEDATRPTPTRAILETLVEALADRGVRERDITIVMALGSHRPMTEVEIITKVGEALYGRIAVVNSEFRDRSRLVYRGCAPGGVEVWVDQRVASADVRIGVGSIVPHPAVGWSGGGKIIYPGVTGEETVAQFHVRHGRTPRNMFGEDDCPVRLEMEEWVPTVGLDFIVNAVVTPDRRIYRVVAGHFIDAHRAGVRYAKEVYQVSVPELADVAVVSSAPANADFWQGGKGILSGDHAVKDGGMLLLVAPCVEGVGPHPEVMKTCRADDPDAVLEEGLKAGGADALALAVGATVGRIRRRLRIGLVTDGLSDDEVEAAGLIRYADIESGLRDAFERYGPGLGVTVIPFGGQTVPVVGEQKAG